MNKTVLIAGQGALPGVLAQALDAAGTDWSAHHLDGFAPAGVAGSTAFRIEHLGTLLAQLRAAGVTQAVFGGALARPAIDPGQIDAATLPLVPRMAQAIASGDDAALRVVIALFEEHGMEVVGAHDVAPALVSPLQIGQPSAADLSDITRARTVHGALGGVDVGQGVVVARGQVLAVEALPGTDWMLRSLVPDALPGFARPAGGIFLKAPKPDQDRRIDLPTIGPQTIVHAHAAGLNGIAVEAGGVILLDPERITDEARTRGLWLHSYMP